jgi:polyhydroxybutyrate depolymerase
MKKRAIFTAIGIVVGLPLLVILGSMTWYAVYDRTNGNIASSGETRDYLLYVPASYEPTEPAPLVMTLHGTALWPALQRDISGWNTLADEYGFIVVYPGATGRPQRKWRLSFTPGAGDLLEVQYISDLIDGLDEAYNIDTARIHMVGLSAGGIMALALACELPDRIAAVAVVAAALPKDYCDDAQPIPLIAFHGTADPIYPFEGGETWAVSEPVESVSKWISGRARQNQCDPVLIEVREFTYVLRREYRGCAARLVHYVIEGGGHQWRGGMQFPEWLGGPVARSIDATSTIWRFFADERL